jgi:hypothetical protein
MQGFGRPVALKGARYKRIFLSGSSAKSFTPDTAEKRSSFDFYIDEL